MWYTHWALTSCYMYSCLGTQYSNVASPHVSPLRRLGLYTRNWVRNASYGSTGGSSPDSDDCPYSPPPSSSSDTVITDKPCGDPSRASRQGGHLSPPPPRVFRICHFWGVQALAFLQRSQIVHVQQPALLRLPIGSLIPLYGDVEWHPEKLILPGRIPGQAQYLYPLIRMEIPGQSRLSQRRMCFVRPLK